MQVPLEKLLPAKELMSMPDPDAELMVQFQRGESQAFEFLVKKYTTPVINLLYKYTNDRQESEDLAQEAFLRVFKAREKYEPRAKFSTWLYTIVVNLALKKIGTQKNKYWKATVAGSDDQEQLAETLAHEDRGPLAQMESGELKHQILQVLSSLPENQRMVVILSKYQDWSGQEIADALGLSISAVKSLLHRARIKIKEKLLPYLKQGIPHERQEEDLL